MPKTITSPSGRSLHHVATVKTTMESDTSVKVIKVNRQKLRRDENEEYLKNANVKAFLLTIAEAEGGGYDFKYGAIKGRKNDPWRFTDFTIHPGAGYHGSTAAGMYQITKGTWKEMGSKMGLDDFSHHTQDLMVVEILRTIQVIDTIEDGDIDSALSKASFR